MSYFRKRILQCCSYFGLSILTACSGNISESSFSNFLNSPDCESTNIYSLSLLKDINLPVPDHSFPTPEHTQVYQDTILYYSAVQDLSRIDIYNLKTEQFIGKVMMDRNFISKPGPFFVHNKDSIFIIDAVFTKERVCLIDAEGVIKNFWPMSGAPLNWSHFFEDVDEYTLWDRNHTTPYYNASDRMLSISFNSDDLWRYPDKASRMLQGTYSIEKNEWVATFGNYNGIYTTDEEVMYPYFYNQPYIIVVSNKRYVSYPMDHNIYIYDNLTGSLLETKCASSSYITSLTPPLSFDKGNDDYQLQINFGIEAAWYRKLYYHKDINMYSRIALHEQELTDADGKLRSWNDRTSSLIIFDEKLNKVGEYLFDNSDEFTLAGGHPIGLGKGILVGKKSELLENDDYMFLSRYYQIIRHNE